MIYKNIENITLKYQNIYNEFRIDPSLMECIDENQMYSGFSETTMNYFWRATQNGVVYNEVFSTAICLSGSESKDYFEDKILEFDPEINNYIVIAFSKAYVNNGLHYYAQLPSLFSDESGTILALCGDRRNDISFECYDLLNIPYGKMGMVDCTRGIFIIDLDFLNPSASHANTKEYTQIILEQSTTLKLKYINFISKEIKPYYNINCSIEANECLYSTNKTFINENGEIIKADIVHDSKHNVKTYATGIYFKDYDDNLLAMAKFRPIEIGKQKLTFNVRIFLR